MAIKYTVTINTTITTEKSQSELIAAIESAMNGVGTSILTQGININAWVDQVNSRTQVFNDDGTPYEEPQDEGLQAEVPQAVEKEA